MIWGHLDTQSELQGHQNCSNGLKGGYFGDGPKFFKSFGAAAIGSRWGTQQVNSHCVP